MSRLRASKLYRNIFFIKVKIVKKDRVRFNKKDMLDVENKIKLAMSEKCRVDFELVYKIRENRNGKYLNMISEI